MSAMGSTYRGRWMVVAAALLWSTSGFFAKAPWFGAWPIESRGLMLAFWRALFATIVLLPMVRRPTWTWRLVPMLAAFVLMNITYLTAMTRTTAANAIWLQNTAPLWVFFVGVLCFKEPVHRLDVVRLVLGGAGIVLILAHELPRANVSGTMFGLASGVTYAGIVLSLRSLRDIDAGFLVAINHFATVVVLLPVVWINGTWPTGGQWPALTLFGMLQMGIPYLLFARGIQHVASHEAAGIALLEPIFVPVWVFLAWHHHPSYDPPKWWTLAGGALILAGLSIRYLGDRPLRDKGRSRNEPLPDRHG